jgi:hypothetical protein
MVYTEHTELEDGKFYYCVNSKSALVSTFYNLPDPNSNYYDKFQYTDYWDLSNGFLLHESSSYYDEIAGMQHYLLPDVNSPEDVARYIKSHPELAL